MSIITCKSCGQVKRNAGRGLCKACYLRQHKATKRAEEKKPYTPRVRGGLGRCECGETAVTRVNLKYGNDGLSAKDGELFNLCAECAEKETRQERMMA